VADDHRTPPAPRPRRRRTDIDPKAPSPPVPNERRRRRKAGDGSPGVASIAPDTSVNTAPEPIQPQPATMPAPGDANVPFHVPGSAAAVVAPGPGGEARTAIAEDAGRGWLGRLDDRSIDPNTCPFLRAAADGALVTPIERPDPANRCAALAEAVPQSLRQQELVCLTSGHISCPRYLRGAAVATEMPAPVVRRGRTLTTPVFASLVVLVMAVSASIAFAMARGGLVLSTAGPSPAASPVAAVPSPVAPAVSASPAVTPFAPASPSPSTSTTPTASPSPVATPTVKPTAAATPRSDRYKLLRACGDAPRCWIYTVRSGDNLYSIANYFGVSRDSIYARNPWLRNSGLRAGQELRLPPPTR
jgi:LysM domain-containing protein